MSAPLTILASLPSFCQKSSKLVEIWQSSDKYKFAVFFWDTVYMQLCSNKKRVQFFLTHSVYEAESMESDILNKCIGDDDTKAATRQSLNCI